MSFSGIQGIVENFNGIQGINSNLTPCYTKRGIFITSLVYLLDHLVNMDNLCEYKFSSWTVNYPSRQETVISKGFKIDCEDFG